MKKIYAIFALFSMLAAQDQNDYRQLSAQAVQYYPVKSKFVHEKTLHEDYCRQVVSDFKQLLQKTPVDRYVDESHPAVENLLKNFSVCDLLIVIISGRPDQAIAEHNQRVDKIKAMDKSSRS
jgi:hypothetical protein